MTDLDNIPDSTPEERDEAYEELQKAIEKYVAKMAPDSPILTDWYMVAASVGFNNGETGYFYPMSQSPRHHIQGLTMRFDQHLVDLENMCTCPPEEHEG